MWPCQKTVKTNLMIQRRTDGQTGRPTDRLPDGQTDRQTKVRARVGPKEETVARVGPEKGGKGKGKG